MDLNIIFEDDEILVLDKPAGLVVNRAETINEQTLQDQLVDYFGLGKSLGIGGRAGIVHRLDRETSGLMVVAKNLKSFEALQRQFKRREVQKEYMALVHGLVKQNDGVVESPIARIGSFGRFGIAKRDDISAREAVTEYRLGQRLTLSGSIIRSVLDQGPTLTRARRNYLMKNAMNYSLLYVYPKTGRTHQIRVHLKYLGHPVVSDKIYGPTKLLKFDLMWCPRLFLHAKAIEFTHPASGKRVFFDSDLPNDLKDVMLNLKELKI